MSEDSEDSILVIETKKKATRGKKTASQKEQGNKKNVEEACCVLDTALDLKNEDNKRIKVNEGKTDCAFSDEDSLVILSLDKTVPANDNVLNPGQVSQTLPSQPNVKSPKNMRNKKKDTAPNKVAATPKNAKKMKKDALANQIMENVGDIAAAAKSTKADICTMTKEMRANESSTSASHKNNALLDHQCGVSESSFLSSESSNFLLGRNRSLEMKTENAEVSSSAKHGSMTNLGNVAKSNCTAEASFSCLEGVFSIDKTSATSANPQLPVELADGETKARGDATVACNNAEDNNKDVNDSNEYILRLKTGTRDKTFALNGSDSMEIVYCDLFGDNMEGKLYFEEMKLSRFLTVEESGFFPGVNYIFMKDDESFLGTGNIDISVKFDENVENDLKVNCLGPERVNDLIRKIVASSNIDLSVKKLVLNGVVLPGDALIADYFASGECVDVIDAKLLDK